MAHQTLGELGSDAIGGINFQKLTRFPVRSAIYERQMKRAVSLASLDNARLSFELIKRAMIAY